MPAYAIWHVRSIALSEVRQKPLQLVNSYTWPHPYVFGVSNTIVPCFKGLSIACGVPGVVQDQEMVCVVL